jgi:hypothetical protein
MNARDSTPSRKRAASRRTRLVAAALAAVVAYMAGAALSGHLSPLARHPLMDGFVPPQPYKWASPPPNVTKNQPPASAHQLLNLPHQDGIGYVHTSDGQVQLIIGKGTWNVPAATGQAAVLVTVDPLDPAKYGAAPPGLTISGNVYLVKTTFQPSGASVDAFTAPVTLILQYPAIATAGITPPPRTILWSKDGRTWTRVATQNAHQQQSAYATVRRPGYYAVSVSPSALAATSSGRGRLIGIVVFVALAVFVLAAAAYVVSAVRRGRREPE